ncbi:MAG: bifunctional 4-hydroxy-2-oxoglutarate aldolase/2-dehydro-3-deoxy-phosphogluconate aldolase [Haloquadratum sp.]|jgi:2-dehydro-3-deoxyphosphogluconate aldolase/(4S)-4-hydroxy-2-oxoglutarate aldolase|nr:bifunctional 4-hydroxy-2-oxoglutarate aldolase/2-dehydro-3-deoxy-phosphogluconate aldolase [Haloferacaceae archaeon]MDR9445563.1 bifunctional 4-hydroxy-2-oxoglutarate aldolase/2-dehydro-3-deoxy-phosphogluconate aldolase [Haloquadratum sp.]
MGRTAVVQRLADAGLVAVLRGVPGDALPVVVDALVAGGVAAVELTADTPGVVESLTAVSADPRVTVGVGTVREPAAVGELVDAGAAFVVSPVCDPGVVAAAHTAGVPAAAGCLTPTEVHAAMDADADIIKIFPASVASPALLAGLRATLDPPPLMPTGGISPTTVGDYLDAGAACVGVGSSLLAGTDPAAPDGDRIRSAAEAHMAAVTAARG